MINKTNANFKEWLRELEQLAKKTGEHVQNSECRWYDYYCDGLTPADALAIGWLKERCEA
jgi:hypothetical protein